jgi:PAS domain S-box-containing protein
MPIYIKYLNAIVSAQLEVSAVLIGYRLRQLREWKNQSQRDIEKKAGQERAQPYLDIADVILLVLDPEARITRINRKGCSTLGWEERDLLGRNWIDTCIPAEIRDKLRTSFHNLLGGDFSYIENPILTKSGEDRLIGWRNTLLRDETGCVIGTLSSGEDITERKRAEDELRKLSGELLRLQDEERRRISRDLHDSTGQNLVALATTLSQLRAAIPAAKRKSRALLSDCLALADQCIREVRTLSFSLHPPLLDHGGIDDVIRDYVHGFAKRSGIQIELELSRSVGRMSRDIELALFRVVQEGLTNIQRHSGSQRAKIRLYRNSNLMLEISDPGRGASAIVPRGKGEPRLKVGVGIASMQERVNLIGGQLEIDSTDQGTTVRVTIPLGGNEHQKTGHFAS